MEKTCHFYTKAAESLVLQVRESFDKMCQNNLKQDDKSLSIRAVSLR